MNLPAAIPWVAAPAVGALLGLAAGLAAARFLFRPGTVARILPSADAAIASLVSSARFLHEVRQQASSLVSSICSVPVAELLGRIGAKSLVVDRLLPALSTEESRKSISRAAGSAAADAMAPPAAGDALDRISRLLEHLLPRVVERLIEWLESGEMRDTLAGRARELLPKILEKLNVMQRFLLSAGQFDRRIDEKMPEIVDETLEALEHVLRDPSQQRAMRDRVLAAVTDWQESKDSAADVSLLVGDLVNGLLERLQDAAVRERVYQSLEKLFTGSGQTLGALLRQRFGLEDREIADMLANAALTRLSRADTRASISAWVAGTLSAFAVDEGPSHGLLAPARSRARLWAGALGALVGLLIGLLEDVLRLLGIV